MGPTRPLAGLGDNQVRLGQFKFYVQLCTVCFVRLKMYKICTFCKAKNVRKKNSFKSSANILQLLGMF